jgi:hypothetical protein
VPERAPASRAELRRRHRYDPRSSTQPRRHHPGLLAETPEPLEPPPTPDPPPSPASTATSPPGSSSQLRPRVASGFTPSRLLDTHLLVPHRPAPPSLAAAPPEAPPAPRLGWPVQVLPGRSRKGGPARSGGPPFLAKARREAKETPDGGAAACCAQGRNPWSETDGGKHNEGNRCPVGDQLLLLPAPALPLPDHSTSEAPRSPSGGRPDARPAQ